MRLVSIVFSCCLFATSALAQQNDIFSDSSVRWLYGDRQSCREWIPMFFQDPTDDSDESSLIPTSVTQVQVSRHSQDGKFWAILLPTGETIYTDRLSATRLEVDRFRLEHECLLPYDPDEVAKRLWAIQRSQVEDYRLNFNYSKESTATIKEYRKAGVEIRFAKLNSKEKKALLGKPSVRIGMNSKTVKTATNWGAPLRIKRTVTERGNQEQWIYEDDRYLYFVNDKLTAIQN